MEDIRFKENDDKIRFLLLIKFMRKQWIKILIILFLISIIIFPTFFGTLIGTWLYNFISSFNQKYILTICL